MSDLLTTYQELKALHRHHRQHTLAKTVNSFRCPGCLGLWFGRRKYCSGCDHRSGLRRQILKSFLVRSR